MITMILLIYNILKTVFNHSEESPDIQFFAAVLALWLGLTKIVRLPTWLERKRDQGSFNHEGDTLRFPQMNRKECMSERVLLYLFPLKHLREGQMWPYLFISFLWPRFRCQNNTSLGVRMTLGLNVSLSGPACMCVYCRCVCVFMSNICRQRNTYSLWPSLSFCASLLLFPFISLSQWHHTCHTLAAAFLLSNFLHFIFPSQSLSSCFTFSPLPAGAMFLFLWLSLY